MLPFQLPSENEIDLFQEFTILLVIRAFRSFTKFIKNIKFTRHEAQLILQSFLTFISEVKAAPIFQEYGLWNNIYFNQHQTHFLLVPN